MRIRPETPADHDAVDAVVAAAFANDGDPEVRLVHRIRAGDGYVPELSLVAEDAGEVVGHIMLSYVRLGPHRVLQLSPLAVAPSHQRTGVGIALTEAALELAEAGGEPLVLVLGHPEYYPRFGFEPARPLGIDPPDDAIPDEPWMVRRLSAYDVRYTGRANFGPAFDEV